MRGSKAVPRMFSVKKLFLKCSQNLQKNTCVWIANAACIICRTAIVTMCNISCLKSGSPSKKIVYICFSKSLFKTMKNAFYFIVKALFVFERFTCLSWPFGYEEKRLDKEAIDNFKIYDVKEWTTNNYNTHIVHISSSQCNQAMKIGQLIEYNTRNIFIEKLYTKYGGEASPRPFHKNQNWTYLWTNSLKCYKVCFYCMFKSKVYQNIFKLKCRTLVFILYKAFFFFKKKKRFGTRLPASLFAWL